MRLLAIDTSTDYISVAITDGEKTAARIHRKAPRSHSSLLMPTIDSCLKKARMKISKIDGFAVSIGPGSFTGLRIGVATVKGLAFVLKKPIVAVHTLDAIAENCRKKKGVICPVLDARKEKVYAAVFESDGSKIRKISADLLVPLKDLIDRLKIYDNVFFLGDFAKRAASMLPGSETFGSAWQPKPETVGAIGSGLFSKRKFVSAEDLEPLYLYSKECDITGV